MHPAPSDVQILQLLAFHGLTGDRVEPSPHEGSVNHVRMVGEWCVRALKVEDYASDILTEAACVPALSRLGVWTPELIAFDDSREIVPGLATIYRRLSGIPLGLCSSVRDLRTFLRELGSEIARWRNGMTEVDLSAEHLDHPQGDDAGECLQRAAERLSPVERTWVESVLRRLEAAPEPTAEFVHWDLHFFNVLVHDGEFEAVIDWGDAGFGDPALNYRCLPAEWLPNLLEPAAADGDFIGRCLYHVLGYALNDVHFPPRYETPYSHTGHQRWESLMRLAKAPPHQDWRDWLGDPLP